MAFLAALISRIPQYLANWLYPRVLQNMMNGFFAGAVLNVHDVGNDLVMLGTSDPSTLATDGPEYAALQIVLVTLEEMNVELTQAEIGPLSIALGQKILADPNYVYDADGRPVLPVVVV
ncbi:MAG: hypothetical protein KOO63_03980 [Bacteroidales bacterium]|nr:hypothetical protein [Candidatus Latescibacterota bacterium]